MIARILDFRFRQIGRMFREIGVIYLILLIFVCFGFFLGLLEFVVRSQSIWMGLVGVMIASSIHFSRKDARFLKMLEVNKVKLYALEYLLLTAPLVIAFLGGFNYGAILVQSIGLILLSYLPNPEIDRSSFSNKLSFNFLSKEVFEARSYLRRFAIPIGLCYILGLITSKYLTIPIVVVLLMAMLFTAFFDEVESKALFEAIHFKKGILSAKIKSYLGLYFLLLLPYILLFLFLHIAYWYILLAGLFVGSTMILFNIFYKYAHYAPYRRRVYNSMANSIFLIAVIIPFFYPVTLLYLVYYWRKARKNIRLYYAENK